MYYLPDARNMRKLRPRSPNPRVGLSTHGSGKAHGFQRLIDAESWLLGFIRIIFQLGGLIQYSITALVVRQPIFYLATKEKNGQLMTWPAVALLTPLLYFAICEIFAGATLQGSPVHPSPTAEARLRNIVDHPSYATVHYAEWVLVAMLHLAVGTRMLMFFSVHKKDAQTFSIHTFTLLSAFLFAAIYLSLYSQVTLIIATGIIGLHTGRALGHIPTSRRIMAAAMYTAALAILYNSLWLLYVNFHDSARSLVAAATKEPERPAYMSLVLQMSSCSLDGDMTYCEFFFRGPDVAGTYIALSPFWVQSEGKHRKGSVRMVSPDETSSPPALRFSVIASQSVVVFKGVAKTEDFCELFEGIETGSPVYLYFYQLKPDRDKINFLAPLRTEVRASLTFPYSIPKCLVKNGPHIHDARRPQSSPPALGEKIPIR